jgi:uncharacterized phage protein gp47/JayE
MSYAAESYPYIAKQVLTALTGGAARETHRFLAALNASGFSTERPADDLIPDSLAVAGISNGEFRVFEEGLDFQAGPDGKIRFFPDEQDALSPAADAAWPDEGSEFYVSYDHDKTGDALLTDRNPGSLTRTLAESFGRELAVLRKQMENVYRSAYLDTAEGPALDRVVALLGVKRRNREHAAGTVRFFRDSAAPADIYIPEATRVSTATNPPALFETTAPRMLRRGQLSVEVDVRAVDKGPKGVVAAGAVTVMNQTLLGIDGVTNEGPTRFGSDGEDDPELRARARKVLERAGRATPRALHLALAELPGLRENDVKIVEELVDRPGVVQVFVAEANEGNRARQVHEAILDTRPAGVRVEHNFQLNLPAAAGGGSEGGGAVSTGDARDDEFEPVGIPGGDSFLVPVEVRVLIFPDNVRLSGAEKARMRLDAEQILMALFDALPVGGAVVYNRLVTALMDLGGIADVNVTLHPPDAPPAGLRRNLMPGDGQRASLTADKLRIHFAGEVSFDFALKVTLPGGHTIEEAHKEIRGKLSEHFAGIPTSISSADLMALIGTGANYSLIAADLTWTAEHDAAGLVLVAGGGPASVTPIPEGDRPILRSIVLEKKA